MEQEVAELKRIVKSWKHGGAFVCLPSDLIGEEVTVIPKKRQDRK